MPTMTFCHGDAEVVHVDYTPTGGNVDIGDVVMLGNQAGLSNGIAERPLTNNVLGTVAIGGVWRAQVASNYPAWSMVYKAAGNAILTTTSTNNLQMGYTLEAAPAANAVVKVLHWPYL